MAEEQNSGVSESVRVIRNAVYGKDVREAIANGLEICYSFTSGEAAIDAAIRATEAVDRLQSVVDGSEEALERIHEASENADKAVIISETQPTDEANKIWIKPRPDTEFKIATYEAYSELWNRLNIMNNTYEQGHGGIVSVEIDETYTDENNPYKKRFTITFSDGTTSQFYMYNGRTGDPGPIDTIESVNMNYCKGIINNGVLVKTPPVTGWNEEIPALSGGDYLWSQTILTYSSGRIGYIYGLSRQGRDGDGTMNSIRLGEDGDVMTHDVILPFDLTPTEGHVNYLVSSDGVKTAIDSILDKTILELVPGFVG